MTSHSTDSGRATPPPPPVQHSFVVADPAGYTALTEADGDEEAANAAADFCQAVRTLLRAHGTHEVKTMGDGVLVHVSDATSAVHLAQRIVCGYGARHGTLGIRAGVHTGTAVKRGDDWFGSAVNLAARIADLATAGEVLITDATRQALDSSVELRSRGAHTFKNVPRPIDIYAAVLDQDPLAALPIDPVCHMAVDPAQAAARNSSTESSTSCAPRSARERSRLTRALHRRDVGARLAVAMDPAATSQAECVVIGAGPAGLAVAARLSRARVETLVLEARGAIAPSWRAR